jgi:hypothetical protein
MAERDAAQAEYGRKLLQHKELGSRLREPVSDQIQTNRSRVSDPADFNLLSKCQSETFKPWLYLLHNCYFVQQLLVFVISQPSMKLIPVDRSKS